MVPYFVSSTFFNSFGLTSEKLTQSYLPESHSTLSSSSYFSSGSRYLKRRVRRTCSTPFLRRLSMNMNGISMHSSPDYKDGLVEY
jgi:hypothetical protein